MSERIRRAEERFVQSMGILEELRLLERWGRVGTPCIVGAMAYGLQVAPDIDLEIFCDRPAVEVGFGVLASVAPNQHVRSARFAHEERGLNYQLRYRGRSGEEWKLEMWLLPTDHPGPLSRDLVTPLRRALTDETREAILWIKEEALKSRPVAPSVHIYQAVLDGGVRSHDEFLAWHRREKPPGLSLWSPTVAGSEPFRGWSAQR